MQIEDSHDLEELALESDRIVPSLAFSNGIGVIKDGVCVLE